MVFLLTVVKLHGWKWVISDLPNSQEVFQRADYIWLMPEVLEFCFQSATPTKEGNGRSKEIT